MKTVYILLTSADTLFGRAIRGLGGAQFSHVSLALDRDLDQLYSFSRRFSFAMLPAGFQREDLRRGVYGRNPQTPCALYALPVTDAVFGRIEDRLGDMYARRWQYHYNLLGILGHVLGRPIRRRRHFFCSEFVAEILRDSGAAAPALDSAMTRPDDFLALPGAQCVYAGPLWGCVPGRETAMPYFYRVPLHAG